MALRLRSLTIHRLAGVLPTTLRPAERTLVVGPNATGKSRLLDLAATLLRGSLGDLQTAPFALDWTLADSHHPTWQLRLHAEATTSADLHCRVEAHRDNTLHRTVIVRSGAPAEVDGRTALVPIGAPRPASPDWWRLQLIPWLVAEGHVPLPDGAKSPGSVRRWSASYFDEITHHGAGAPYFELAPHKVYWRAAPDWVKPRLMALCHKPPYGCVPLNGVEDANEGWLRALLDVDALHLTCWQGHDLGRARGRTYESLRWTYTRGEHEVQSAHWSDGERHLAGLWWYLACSPDMALVDGLDAALAPPWGAAVRAAMVGRQVWETALDANDAAGAETVVRCEAVRGADGLRWLRWGG